MSPQDNESKTDDAESPSPVATSEKPGPGTAQPPLAVAAQYIKDLSFEAPSSPEILAEMQKDAPEISVNVNVNVHPKQEPVFEVILHLRAECTVTKKTAFILELEYGGLFSVNVPAKNLQPVLLIECPRLLFPFARNILAEVSRDGGFPPLMLGPVDFAAMYQNQQTQAQQTGGIKPQTE